MATLHLIAGLGNPGRQYARTRHNAGFLVVEGLARRWRAPAWSSERKFKARLARGEKDGRQVLLCLPDTFMNASGEAIGAVMAYYQVPRDHLLVVTDDADLPLGELRLRARGSAGGHHGLESVEQHLGTRDYARLRVGIGREPQAERQITDYVLSEFAPGERELLEKVLTRAGDQIECWLADGLAKAMNRFNGRITI